MYQAAEASVRSGEAVGDGSVVASDPEDPLAPGLVWEGTGARWGVQAWACRGVHWLEAGARALGEVQVGVGRGLVAGAYNGLEAANGPEAVDRGAGAGRVDQGRAGVRGLQGRASLWLGRPGRILGPRREKEEAVDEEEWRAALSRNHH